jgi:ectoine hydroxylase-related dioxygenase (phytanoyl-CoA dioxygenase family)
MKGVLRPATRTCRRLGRPTFFNNMSTKTVHSQSQFNTFSAAADSIPSTRELTAAEVAFFNAEGYLIVKGLFSDEEAALLLEAGHKDQILAQQAFDQKDQDGKSSKLLVWNQPVPDANVFNTVARSRRLVNAAERLLGGQEVYHWHSKLMLKEPAVGGAWEWHQDYGYWYNQGLLYPDLLSAMVALEPATQANGCLELLAGTHAMGRIDHALGAVRVSNLGHQLMSHDIVAAL